jgi:hypothetical protein
MIHNENNIESESVLPNPPNYPNYKIISNNKDINPIDENRTFLQNIDNSSWRIFSSAIGIMKSFFSLKWYIILFIVVFGSFLFFQIESAIEIRKNKRKMKKEGMNNNNNNDNDIGDESNKVEYMKSILRQTEKEYKENEKKHVSFFDSSSAESEPTTMAKSNNELNLVSFMTKYMNDSATQIYNWWILPWMYVLFRNIGFA